MAPVVGLILPTSPPPSQANQTLPSGPAVIPFGPRYSSGRLNSLILVRGRIDLTDLVRLGSVNQRLPLEPAVIFTGPLLPDGRANELKA